MVRKVPFGYAQSIRSDYDLFEFTGVPRTRGTWMRAQQSLAVVLLIGVTLAVVRPAVAEVTDEQARKSIDHAVKYLLSTRTSKGGWTESWPGATPGVTALVTLALLNSGVDVKSKEIQASLTYLRAHGSAENTYGNSLQTMVFCIAEPNKDRALISRNVQWLEKNQIREGKRIGAWGYSESQKSGDNSNTQFAVLALYEAERIGVKVDKQTWKLALDYWLSVQSEDGSWCYTKNDPGSGSMTCAGIASVIICSGRVNAGDSQVVGERVECCGSQSDNAAVKRGIEWLGKHFSVQRNPGGGSVGRSNWLYYLYALERVGRMSGNRFIGQHDWFREGVDVLISLQDDLSGQWRGDGLGESNPIVGTSLALLFMSKGRRPVVMSKLQHTNGPDWDRHRSGVQNLTFRIEQRWKRDLSWQSIDLRAATPEDLAQSPVLFLSGRDSLKLSPPEANHLREYVQRGGFIFAEACCGGAAFDRDFRELMKSLFPDSQLRLLPPDHPIWYAEQKVDPAFMKPLYGIDACCRTSVVYCPQDLSCLWELSEGNREAGYPAPVRNEIEACLRIGANVLTYATNRELRNKLDQAPGNTNKAHGEALARGTLNIVKLQHSGGSDEAPNALPNLLAFVREQAQMRVVPENKLLSATDPALLEYPLVFMHGRRQFRFSPAERQALATYIDRGGVLFADAICASSEFVDSFRREISAIFPGRSLERIPPNHALFSRSVRGFDLPKVTLRDPQIRQADDPLRATLTQVSPVLEGLAVGDRLAVILSPYDLSCALENGASLECKGYIKEDAARLGTNVVLFTLLQ